MWVFSKCGYFSIVAKNEGTDGLLTVRSRVRSDLVRLKVIIPELSEIKDNEGTDYPFRCTGLSEDVARGMSKITTDINYHNFKNMILEKFGYEREKIYARVWGVLQGLTTFK